MIFGFFYPLRECGLRDGVFIELIKAFDARRNRLEREAVCRELGIHTREVRILADHEFVLSAGGTGFSACRCA